MENNIEKRVSKLEDRTNKLAKLTQQLSDGEKTLVEVINDLSGDIAEEAREAVKTQFVAISTQIGQDVDTKLGNINSTIEDIQDAIKNDELSGEQLDELKKERNRRVIHLLNGIKSDKYKVFGSAYFAQVGQDVLFKFKQSETKLLSFKRIKKVQFNDVLSYVRSWYPNESKVKSIVIANMLILKDETTDLKSEINSGNLLESEKYVKAVEISKNELKLKVFNKLMNAEFGGIN